MENNPNTPILQDQGNNPLKIIQHRKVMIVFGLGFLMIAGFIFTLALLNTRGITNPTSPNLPEDDSVKENNPFHPMDKNKDKEKDIQIETEDSKDSPTQTQPDIPSIPKSENYCQLDLSLDSNLLYTLCPRIQNKNAGFTMDTQCKSGWKCTYACEPPYVNTENGFSNEDCVPYLGRCDVYDPKTYKGGLLCEAGKIVLQHPQKPLCTMGLNTSYVYSEVDDVISSCQTVYPGNEIPMIGMEIFKGQIRQLTSFPSWYWQQTHAHFYIHIPGKIRSEACQWNYDPNSLNSGGVDAMPYIIGGGSSPSLCKECAQHNMDIGENFDFKKDISGLPRFGVRARNCNDKICGQVLCDATFVYNKAKDELSSYWVKYNTIYGHDKVGCVLPAVWGNDWDASRGVHKYTRFDYYPIDINGRDTSCKSSECSSFNPGNCRLFHPEKVANYGTGINPAMYICQATEGALTREYLLNQMTATVFSNKSFSSIPIIGMLMLCLFAVCLLIGIVMIINKRNRHRCEKITTDLVDIRERSFSIIL